MQIFTIGGATNEAYCRLFHTQIPSPADPQGSAGLFIIFCSIRASADGLRSWDRIAELRKGSARTGIC
jgi:hypothetical protein